MSGFRTVLESKTKKALPKPARKASFDDSHLEVRMFNVGKGEAIVLTFPGKRAWLLEGGCTNSLKKLGPALAKFLNDDGLVLEAIVLSHPHRDHGGAIKDLLGPAKLAATLTFYRSDESAYHNTSGWLKDLRLALAKPAFHVKEKPIKTDGHVEVAISGGVNAHLYTGQTGKKLYRSVFLHLRYGDARLLFTGDAYCSYECDMVGKFPQADFRADVLKVTHHGSSSGTAKGLIDIVKPGIAIASTADDPDHSLEFDVLARLSAGGAKPEIYETLVDGDIILKTDGLPYAGGVLYHIEFESDGRFADTLGPKVGVKPLAFVNSNRQPLTPATKHKKCKKGC